MNRPGGPDRAPGRAVGSVTAALLAAGLLAACAKEEAPPGALPDSRPPQVARTEPPDRAVVPDLGGDAKIVFDEPINAPGDLARQLVGSPAYRYAVSSGFSDIKIHPDGGWRRGAVYVLRIPKGIPDLLNNRTEEPIRLIFSTGPPVTDTRVSGRLLERVTGRPARDARVVFRGAGDSIPYTAVEDSGGSFELPALPPGRYEAWGFRDLNADLELQRRLEPYDSAAFELADSSSTAQLTLRLTEPDSTPPRLVRPEVVDSVTLALVFDDYLDPVQDFAAAPVTVRDSASGEAWPVERVGISLPAPAGGAGGQPGGAADTTPGAEATGAAADTVPGPAADTGVAADSGAARSAPADTAPADTGPVAPAAPADTGPAAPVDTGPAEPADTTASSVSPGAPARADTAALPSQRLLLRLGRPLEPGTYRVTASGLLNLRELGGGGDTTFVYPPPDTTAVPPDGEAG